MHSPAVDPGQLEAFVAVMSAGSITAAARLLQRSQPAVTRAIQELEASLGLALFSRNGPRIAPTEFGVRFHEEAERMLFGLRHLHERAQAIAAGMPRAIEIAAIPALASGLVPLALARLDPTLLPAQVHLQAASAEQVVRAILSRSADLGLASLPVDHPGVEVRWCGRVPCVAALAADDPLAARPRVAIRDFAGRRLVSMANPYRLRRRIDQALAASGTVPAAVTATNASSTALALIRAGGGIGIVEPVTALGAPLDGVVIRPLDVEIPFLWGVVLPLGRPVAPAVEHLVAALATAAITLLPGFRQGSWDEIAGEPSRLALDRPPAGDEDDGQ
ncbi:MAG TPA: LysR family transcriptional regulator [Geminicoccus sp.]|uniref:LysR family transcriptional regulator n=1 Tax=Geminicoccus sp. TaxID=2024832 RepID=UPI002CCFBEC6|nr:LysR family transcriptional regulator [Geminicoccus sp.]HWL69877.1 LysR family transcriptional regulator [Geminicoccus sp.]